MKYCLLILLNLLLTCLKGIAQEVITVEAAVDLALQKNYDIQLSRSISSAAGENYKYSIGAFAPSITGNANRIWNNNDQKQTLADGTKRERNNIKSDNLNASVQLNWVLFDGTRMFATRKRLEEIATQGELSIKEQVANTVADVVNNYFNIVREKQQLKAIREQMSISEERVKLAEKKLQVGTGAKPELLQARVDLNAQRSNAIQQQTLIAQLKRQLNGLSGMRLPDQYEVSDSIPINLGIQQEIIAGNIESTNPSLQVIRKNIDIASLNLRERKADRYPVISFNSAYNFSRTNNQAVVNPSQSLFIQNKGFNYGFSATIPILNGFNTRLLVRQAELNMQYQQLFYDQQKMQVNINIQNAFINYDNAKKILQIEEENIGLAKENTFIALETFRRGATTFIELRTAQQSLADAYNRLIIARYNAKLAETELLRLNGGLIRE